MNECAPILREILQVLKEIKQHMNEISYQIYKEKEQGPLVFRYKVDDELQEAMDKVREQ